MTITPEPGTPPAPEPGTKPEPGTPESGRLPGPGVFSEPDNRKSLNAITALDVKLVLPQQLNAKTFRDLKFYFNEIPGKPRVFLRKVRIEIPVGEGQSDLTTVGGAQAIRPSAAGGGPGGWAGQGTGTPSGKALFDFGPNNAADVDPFTGFGLVLTLPNVKINDVASTTPLQIKVTVYTSPLATTPETSWTASTDIPSGVYKFPTDFEFSGLRVEEVMIPYNTSGTLRWESQAANCTVVYKPIGGGNDVRIDVGAAKEWITPKLTTYTNFRVEARSIQTQNTTIYALNTTALVDRPDLTLNTLHVNGETELMGLHVNDKTELMGKADIFQTFGSPRDYDFSWAARPGGGKWRLEADGDGLLMLMAVHNRAAAPSGDRVAVSLYPEGTSGAALGTNATHYLERSSLTGVVRKGVPHILDVSYTGVFAGASGVYGTWLPFAGGVLKLTGL
ncbi:hypothetical protein [Streptomyces sp. NPDC001719]